MNQSSSFLLDKNGNKFTTFPTDVYIDTCFWNEIIGANTYYGDNCRRFFHECRINNTTMYTSFLVKEELTRMVRDSFIQDYIANNNLLPTNRLKKYSKKDKFKLVLKTNPSVAADIEAAIDKVINIVDNFTEDLPYNDTNELDKNMQSFLKVYNYAIDTSDAKHIIIAHSYGINSIATIDEDYAYADNLNIYAPPTKFYISANRPSIYLPFDANKY